jgi:hypothetical protein
MSRFTSAGRSHRGCTSWPNTFSTSSVLFSPTLPTDRQHVLYRDDRQVKLLHVHLWDPSTTGASTIPEHTAVTARPLRDVSADMALVRPIEDESITLNDEDSPLYSPPIPDIEFEPVFDIPRASSAEEANLGVSRKLVRHVD